VFWDVSSLGEGVLVALAVGVAGGSVLVGLLVNVGEGVGVGVWLGLAVFVSGGKGVLVEGAAVACASENPDTALQARAQAAKAIIEKRTSK